MENTDIKGKIQEKIIAFKEGSLYENALALFNTLGYQSQKHVDFSKDRLLQEFNRPEFRGKVKENALVDDWKEVAFIFQLTDDEIKFANKQQGTIDFDDDNTGNKVNDKIFESYFVFAIELKREDYTRTKLSQITRAINRLFRMPTLILFKYGSILTLSVINRRLNKNDNTKDVLEKVTLIKDINIEDPHRAHTEILFDLSFDKLKNKHPFINFIGLHDAWKKTLDIKELNKRFYNDLFNWYLWAIKKVSFPNNEKDANDDMVYNSESVIRLLTRLIFVWFIKEKNLVPEDFFQLHKLNAILKDYKPLSEKTSVYYRAILQNLFFATLNSPMENDTQSEGEKRRFINLQPKTNNPDFKDQTKYRYENYFSNPKEALKLFSSIPFLNGGLFECLDIVDEKIRYDGFSSTEASQAFIPDKLFFAEKFEYDLNADYDTKGKKYFVCGLINILNNYKFTITENTPLEEEIALDPELLGKVFENLLASYNPETKTTARKKTGSFYTPREIVNYMVDESLIAYLKEKLNNNEETEKKLRNLFSHIDNKHKFTAIESNILIKAISEAKILDPACGSGAFPMGILHRMVDLLNKLDFENKKWRELQKERAIAETSEVFNEENMNERKIRLEEINKAFDENMNYPDYARKLYLIENCIYGVDIQQIAIQISKLRFFISLIVDQKVNDEKPNRNILSMPNLETKFVAANTLIGLDKPKGQLSLMEMNNEIAEKERELRNKRRIIFFTRNYYKKKKLKKEEKTLREELFKILLKNDMDKSAAEQMAGWNPFDPIKSASFFDSKTMFSLAENFDIIIGNPPWGAKLLAEEKELFKRIYNEIDSSTPNTFSYFIGWAFKNYKCVISYVLPDSILIKDYAKTRGLMKNFISEIVWFENIAVPEEHRPFVYVDHDVCVINLSQKNNKKLNYSLCRFDKSLNEIVESKFTQAKSKIILEEFDFAFNLIARDKDFNILEKISKFDKIDEFMQCHEGIHTGNCREILFHNNRKNKYCYPLFYGGGAGDTIDNYLSKTSGWFVDYRAELIEKSKGYYASLRDERIFKNPKIYITRTGNPFKAFYDENNYASNNFFSLQHIDYDKNDCQFLKFILTLIISKPAQYFIRTFAAPRLSSTFIETKIFHLLKFRIPIISAKDQHSFVDIVENILSAKDRDIDAKTHSLEKKLEVMIYKLYKLTYDEVLVVDSEFEMSREDYDSKDYGFEYITPEKTTEVAKAKVKRGRGKTNYDIQGMEL